MGTVTTSDVSNLKPVAKRLVSPFFSRSYGGYSAGQCSYILEELGSVAGTKILDPMAGQAFFLSRLANEGAKVYLADLNPGPLLLASLRDPELIKHRHDLAKWYKSQVAKCRRSEARVEFVDDWLSDCVKGVLRSYRERFRLARSGSDALCQALFGSLQERFSCSIPVLAARELACFRASDNVTWPKRGGIQRRIEPVEVLLRAADAWLEYASQEANEGRRTGSLTLLRNDLRLGPPPRTPVFDLVITSPPYANRLDYSQQWGPEFSVTAALCELDGGLDIKTHQIGSTVVRGFSAAAGSRAVQLPEVVVSAIRSIAEDTAHKASATYYRPFFENYAFSLARALKNVSTRVRQRGKLLIFFRDTVRKDVLFPTGALIEDVLCRQCGFVLVKQQEHIIRHHLGFRRRESSSGIYGLAQREYWQTFERSS